MILDLLVSMREVISHMIAAIYCVRKETETELYQKSPATNPSGVEFSVRIGLKVLTLCSRTASPIVLTVNL